MTPKQLITIEEVGTDLKSYMQDMARTYLERHAREGLLLGASALDKDGYVPTALGESTALGQSAALPEGTDSVEIAVAGASAIEPVPTKEALTKDDMTEALMPKQLYAHKVVITTKIKKQKQTNEQTSKQTQQT
jgi:hypothetical protein